MSQTISGDSGRLVDCQGVLKHNRYTCPYDIIGDEDQHYCNSRELYITFKRDPRAEDLDPWGGDVDIMGSGTVKVELADGVKLLLHDVMYHPKLLENHPLKIPRVVIGLPKFLADTGATRDVDAWGNWIIRKDGKLLVFCAYEPLLPNDPNISPTISQTQVRKR